MFYHTCYTMQQKKPLNCEEGHGVVIHIIYVYPFCSCVSRTSTSIVTTFVTTVIASAP